MGRQVSFLIAVSVNPIPWKSIAPTTLPKDVRREKPSANPRIHPLQAQAYFLSLVPSIKLATSQPMLQVCTQAVEQGIGLPVFKFCILALTLVYRSHKPYMSLPVSFIYHPH